MATATRSSALAGQASLREALIAAVEKSGKIDPLIVAPRRRKRGPAARRRHERRKATVLQRAEARTTLHASQRVALTAAGE